MHLRVGFAGTPEFAAVALDAAVGFAARALDLVAGVDARALQGARGLLGASVAGLDLRDLDHLVGGGLGEADLALTPG